MSDNRSANKIYSTAPIHKIKRRLGGIRPISISNIKYPCLSTRHSISPYGNRAQVKLFPIETNLTPNRLHGKKKSIRKRVKLINSPRKSEQYEKKQSVLDTSEDEYDCVNSKSSVDESRITYDQMLRRTGLFGTVRVKNVGRRLHRSSK